MKTFTQTPTSKLKKPSARLNLNGNDAKSGDLSPMAANVKNGAKQAFSFAEPDKTQKTGGKPANQEKQRLQAMMQHFGAQQLENALTLLNHTSQISHQSLQNSSGGGKPKKRIVQKSLPVNPRPTDKELLIQQLKHAQLQAMNLMQPMTQLKSSEGLKHPKTTIQDPSLLLGSTQHPSISSTKHGGSSFNSFNTKKFDRLNQTSNMQGISQIAAQTALGHAGSSEFATGLMIDLDQISIRRGQDTANNSRITSSMQYSNGSAGQRKLNISVGTTNNTEIESSNAVSRIGDASITHNIDELTRQPVVKRTAQKVRASHLLVKSTERAGQVKISKKSARADYPDASEILQLAHALKYVTEQQKEANTTFTQQTAPASKVMPAKQKSKSFVKAPIAKTAAGLLKLNASSEPHEEPIRIPSQPVTTSHQSMLQKHVKQSLEKVETSKSKRLQDNQFQTQQPLHPLGVSSATNKVQKTFNFEVQPTGQQESQYEAQKRELLSQLLMHAVGQKQFGQAAQQDFQLANQQMLLFQAMQEQPPKVEIDTSRKALISGPPSHFVGSQVQSTKNQDSKTKKGPKVTKSVGQSKPPAHAQYFEQASAPVKQKIVQPTRKSSVQPQTAKAKTKPIDKMAPFSVININIDNGSHMPGSFMAPSSIDYTNHLKLLTNQPSESHVIAEETARIIQQHQSKQFSPRLQSIQPASQSVQAASFLTTTHLDKPSLQFAIDMGKNQRRDSEEAREEQKKQPLRLNIKRGEAMTRKEMETIAIFNKFFKEKIAQDTKQKVESVRGQASHIAISARAADELAKNRRVEASVTNDRPVQRKNFFANETSSSNVELQNPVAPASGVDKSHSTQLQNDVIRGAHKRMHSLFTHQPGNQLVVKTDGRQLATIRNHDAKELTLNDGSARGIPQSHGFQTTKHHPSIQRPFQIQTNNFVHEDEQASPKSINPVHSSSTKARGNITEDAFAITAQTQNAPKAKNQPRMFGDDQPSREVKKDVPKGPLTVETNQVFYPRAANDFGAANKNKTQELTSLLRQVRDEPDLVLQVQESMKEEPIESEEALIVQHPAKGNQKLPIQPTFSSKKPIGATVSSPRSIDSDKMRPFIEKTADKPAEKPDLSELLNSQFPMKVRQALKMYAKSGLITDYEKTELLDYSEVYFLGLEASKIRGGPGKNYNYGYDDENGDYKVVLKDHIAYRFEVLDFLGKGSFGQALRCFDHLTKEIVAIKIIRSKEKFQHQARVELQILQHLKDQDPEDTNNIIQIKDSCEFRKHLIISFELFSINLYEFIKNNNFQGISLSLIRRFAIQILQALKYLREENVIHCDLKPENILLKSPDKSGIKIIDFGSSCFTDQRIYTYIQSRFYRAPEIILGIPYTTAIDMWSFGCILVELATGFPIFPGESEHEQLALIMQVFGPPSTKILDVSQRRANFFPYDSNQPLFNVEDSQGNLRVPGSRPLVDIIGSSSESFFDFVQQCLTWDPEERITPFQALQHSWILEGLPPKVLVHHQRMLGLDVPSSDSHHSNETPVHPDSSKYESTPHGQILNAQGEPITPLVINDFNENEFNVLDDLQNESIDQFSKQQLQTELMNSHMIKQEQNRADGIYCRQEGLCHDIQVKEEPQIKKDMNRTQPMPMKFLDQKKRIIEEEEKNMQSTKNSARPRQMPKHNQPTEKGSANLQQLKLEQQKSKTTNMTEILRKLNTVDNAANSQGYSGVMPLPVPLPSHQRGEKANNVSQKMSQLKTLQQNPQAHPNRGAKEGQFSFLMSHYIKQTGK